MVPVCARMMEDMRTSSQDCVALFFTRPSITSCTPETMFCEEGEVDITTVSAAALTVIVFMSKVPVEMVIVLPEVWPVTPLQLEGTVVTTTVELLATLEFILPLMV